MSSRRTGNAAFGPFPLAAGILFLFLLVPAALPTAAACTGFLIGLGDEVFAGNNEDWLNPNTELRFVPAEDGRYGRVYFGFDDAPLQGGMNDQGLFFDGFATSPHPVETTAHLPRFRGNPVDEAMARCATVAEVVELFAAHDRRFMKRYMLFFGDASGDAVIVEGDKLLRKEGRFQVVTNFHQSETAEPMLACRRYGAATRLLEKARRADVELCRRVLDATHADGRSTTLYSNVYDLKRRVVYLYHFHDFENVVVLDLERELAKGARTLPLPELFPRKAAEVAFREEYARAMERRRAALNPVQLPIEALERCAGIYEVVEGELAAQTVAFVVEGGKLLLKTGSGGRGELIPVSETRFVLQRGEVDLRFAFEGGSEPDPARAFVVEWEGGKARGRRVKGP